MLDTDNDGIISTDELTLGMLAKGLSEEDISALFRALDTDGSGSISLSELTIGLQKFHEVIGTEPPEEEPEAAWVEPERPVWPPLFVWDEEGNPRPVWAQKEEGATYLERIQAALTHIKAFPPSISTTQLLSPSITDSGSPLYIGCES